MNCPAHARALRIRDYSCGCLYVRHVGAYRCKHYLHVQRTCRRGHTYIYDVHIYLPACIIAIALYTRAWRTTSSRARRVGGGRAPAPPPRPSFDRRRLHYIIDRSSCKHCFYWRRAPAPLSMWTRMRPSSNMGRAIRILATPLHNTSRATHPCTLRHLFSRSRPPPPLPYSLHACRGGSGP